MKFLVIGDPHFREGCVKDMELFIEEVMKIVEELKHSLDFIVVLGDVMDRHGILHQKPFHQSCRFLINLSKCCMTYCLIGNHDFDIPSVYLPENHPYKVMVWNEIPNLKIVDKPQVINNIFFTPYVPVGMFQRAVSDALNVNLDCQDPWWEMLSSRNIRLGFAHQEFRGCQMGNLKSDLGDEWPEDKRLGEMPFIISGHIHSYQMLGENIMYTGTPIQVNYGEGIKKGICLLDFDEKTRAVDQEWYKIRVPRKLVKCIRIEDLDKWVNDRYGSLMERYDLPPVKLKVTKKQTSDNINLDTIIMLNTNKSLLEELRTRVNNDRYLDTYKVQVIVRGKIPGIAIKNAIMKLRDLPLAIAQIFINEVSEGDDGNGYRDDEVVDRIKWLDVLIQRLESKNPEDDNPKLGLLREILNDLTNKI